MRRFQVRWLSKREADRFVAKHHRHHQPIHVAITQLGLWEGDELVGVAVLGRPLARGFDQKGGIIEITRLCVVPEARHAASALLGRCRRVAQALGFERVLTYTGVDEPGASLKAAGFQADLELVGGRGWDMPGRRRNEPTAPVARRQRWWSGLKEQREIEL